MKRKFIIWILISISFLFACGKKKSGKIVQDEGPIDVYNYSVSKGCTPLNDSLIFGILLNPKECVNCYIVFNILKKDLRKMQDGFAFSTAFYFPEMREVERKPFRNKELGLKDFTGAHYFYSDSIFSYLSGEIQNEFILKYPKSSGILILNQKNKVLYYQDFKKLKVKNIYRAIDSLTNMNQQSLN